MAQRDEDTGTKSPLLDDDEIGLIDESLRLLSDRADIVVSHFYAMLFAEAPHLRALFPAAMDVQRDRLFRALGGITRTFGEPDRLLPLLAQLGRDHRRYGVRAEHYDVFGRALVAALRYHAKDVWVPELEDAWNKALAVIADAMQAGAREAATREPAWWKGEIVGHERRADDIAVLVVRPDRPYDYVPGQFATVETPYRPRSWRTYSMATAPSPDGLLEFHVRAVGAGWVSGPLVWRAQVGDVVRIGAPAGRDAHRPPVPPRRGLRSRRHRAGADQGDGGRHVPLEHCTPGDGVLRRPPVRRPLRPGRPAPAGRGEPLAHGGPGGLRGVKVRR